MKEIGKPNSPLLIFIIYFEGRNLLKTDSPVPTCIGEIGKFTSESSDKVQGIF